MKPLAFGNGDEYNRSMFGKKNRKKLYYNNVDPQLYLQIKLLSIAANKPMYVKLNEVLREGIKVYLKDHENEIEKKMKAVKDII
jgi:hypothetical protein